MQRADRYPTPTRTNFGNSRFLARYDSAVLLPRVAYRSIIEYERPLLTVHAPRPPPDERGANEKKNALRSVRNARTITDGRYSNVRRKCPSPAATATRVPRKSVKSVGDRKRRISVSLASTGRRRINQTVGLRPVRLR